MGWSEWSNAKKGGIIGGSLLAALIIIGAGVGIAIGTRKGPQIEMWVPWDVSPQLTALEEITDLYNDTHGDNEYKIVVSTAGEGGYKESGFTVTNEQVKLNMNHKEELPDMVINNQDMLSIVGSEMAVNLADEKYGLDTTQLQITDQDPVAGITTGEGLYGLRFYSTQNIAVDLPMLIWLEDKGIITFEGESDISTAVNELKGSDRDLSKDFEEIEKYYATNTEAPEAFVVNDETFTSQLGLRGFADTVLEYTDYVNTTNPGENGIVAYTNPQTEFMTALQSISGGAASTEMVETTDEGNKYLFLTEPDELTKAEQIWNEFSDGTESDAYWLGGAQEGTYSSDKIHKHQSPISIGSTSGTSYNVTAGDDELLNNEEIYYTNSYATFNESTSLAEGESPVYKSQGPSLMVLDRGMSDSDKRIEESIDFIDWLISPEKNVSINDNGDIVEGDDMTAGVAFSIVSDFLINTKSAVEYVDSKTESGEFGDHNEPGLALIAETMQNEDKSANLYSEPNDQNSAEFWGLVKTELKVAEDNVSSKGEDFTKWEEAANNIIDQVNQKGLDARGKIDNIA